MPRFITYLLSYFFRITRIFKIFSKTIITKNRPSPLNLIKLICFFDNKLSNSFLLLLKIAFTFLLLYSCELVLKRNCLMNSLGELREGNCHSRPFCHSHFRCHSRENGNLLFSFPLLCHSPRASGGISLLHTIIVIQILNRVEDDKKKKTILVIQILNRVEDDKKKKTILVIQIPNRVEDDKKRKPFS